MNPSRIVSGSGGGVGEDDGHNRDGDTKMSSSTPSFAYGTTAGGEGPSFLQASSPIGGGGGATSTTSSGNTHHNNNRVRLEQEVAWNPAQVHVDLQAACQILSERGWKLAAKWAAEQWMGLPALPDAAAEGTTTIASVQCSIPEALVAASASASHSPVYAYAKTLLDVGEFAHAAAVLSQQASCCSHGNNNNSYISNSSIVKWMTVERMPPPLLDLPAAAIALRAYALYMAGERRKEELLQEGGYVT